MPKLARLVSLSTALSLPRWCMVQAVEEDGILEVVNEEEFHHLPDQQVRKLFGVMDANTDGRVSRHETVVYSQLMKGKMRQRDIKNLCDSMDVDGDRKISLAEFLKDLDVSVVIDDEDENSLRNSRRMQESLRFTIADADHNGYIDGDEIGDTFFPDIKDDVLSHVKYLELIDKDDDGDGELTLKEFLQRDSDSDEDVRTTKEEQDNFLALDVDGNGMLSLAELKEAESNALPSDDAIKQVFEFGDKDHDMHLSLAELMEARKLIKLDVRHPLVEWATHAEL